MLLAACGGGGGGMSSTPSPVTKPTPTPTPAAASLGNVTTQTSFKNYATATDQELTGPDNTVVNTSSTGTSLSFSYDPETKTYTLTDNGETSSFGVAELYDNGTSDTHYHISTSDGFDALTLFDPKRLGLGMKYATIGLWQRRQEIDSDNANFTFDVFAYGFPTAASGVPLAGSATYDIDLFGVASPVGTFPRSIIGDGTFSLDFGQGLFAMSGEAGEYNNDADYSTCCSEWWGAGYLASNGGISGYFTYSGRENNRYQVSVTGSLFGPSGSEVGASLVGTGTFGSSFTGAFVGSRAHDGIDVALSARDTGARTYGTLIGTSTTTQHAGSPSSEAAGYYFTSTFGSLDFAADGSITPDMRIMNSRFVNVTFAPSDLLASQSDDLSDVYEVHNADANYRLQLFKPENPEIQLTYSSFGYWSEDRAIDDNNRQKQSSWFIYGVRTIGDTLPRSGTAHYDATVIGSGERLADREPLTLAGTTSIDVDFATTDIDGSLTAQAWTSSNQLIDLPDMDFHATGNAYNFDTYLNGVIGSIRGALYGPSGEEIGGTFEFVAGNLSTATFDASYSGVFYGKKD
ncbi:hypothetical protein GRI89_14190 [Altererythrobacter salegens]|uniref:Transferrin-binding protein B C-lobe/N-lobe beta-barrel domain-containing protein n=1 Tax=Croceibacterium salegens TaxID=1737568 RepID=A0A6I4SZM3_9SPHN|nr:transferrin-binding protein-like solute binding protein [Croceibacterium salegens]MXO60690.1 hypothetical protein [Croceibacterium salegens]